MKYNPQALGAKDAFVQYLAYARNLSDDQALDAEEKVERLMAGAAQFGLLTGGAVRKVDGRVLVLAKNLRAAFVVYPSGEVRYGRYDAAASDVVQASAIMPAAVLQEGGSKGAAALHTV